MNNTFPRVRAGQPVTDDGSCWRHIAERQQAIMERDAVPGYTAGAVEAMDAGDPKPERTVYYRVIDRDLTPRWLLFVAGVMLGAVACAWVMTP
jgi:hypothetical protein